MGRTGRSAVLGFVGLALVALTASVGPRRGLDGRTFVSTQVFGPDVPAGTTLTLTFDAGVVHASAGCTFMFGAASWDDGVLRTDVLAATEEARDPSGRARGAWVGDLLAAEPRLVLAGDTLVVGDERLGARLVSA